MLVKELLEKLDTSSEIDLIEIICNGESKIFYSLIIDNEYLNKEVERIDLRTRDEYTENMNGTFCVSDTTKIIVIEVE